MPLTRAESERLRESFADVLRRQALEASQLAPLAAADPDLRDALQEILERVRDAARSLNLVDVERAAADAVEGVAAGTGGPAIALLLEQCRSLDVTAEVLRPILVVAGTAQLDAEGADPLVWRAASVDDALAVARRQTPLALVLPITALVDARGLDDPALVGVPVYAYGPTDDLDQRLAAARAGAAGYFGGPHELRGLAGRVRLRALSPSEPDRVLIVGASEAVAMAWVRAFAGRSVEISVLRTRSGLLAALEEVDPFLLVLGDPHAAELATVLRGHPDWWDLPRVVVAEEPSPAIVELTLPASLSGERLRLQGTALLERARQERELRALERSTGVLPRAALLRAAERETALARRSRRPLTVARVVVDEPAALRRTHGTVALAAAVRLLARAARETVRDTDIVGRVGDAGLGILLPGATVSSVRVRLMQIERRFAALVQADPRLEGVTVTGGLADTEESPDELFERADRDRIRAGGRSGS
jgi:GGDEF domain-containing protein